MQKLTTVIEGVVSVAPVVSTETLRSLLHAVGLPSGPEVSTFMAPRTILNSQITDRRRFASYDFSVREIRTVAKHAECDDE